MVVNLRLTLPFFRVNASELLISFCVKPAVTRVAISKAIFTSSRPERLISFSNVSLSTNSIV